MTYHVDETRPLSEGNKTLPRIDLQGGTDAWYRKTISSARSGGEVQDILDANIRHDLSTFLLWFLKDTWGAA